MFPSKFTELVSPILGDEIEEFLAALQEEPPVSVRLNNKVDSKTALEDLTATSSVEWCRGGFYLESRPKFTLNPLFHSGSFYVQEASSMFLDLILQQNIKSDAIALDLCSAPGGKATIISSHLNDGFLVANEYVSQRSHILAENLTKWGNANYIVCNNRPVDFKKLNQKFDLILVDAPCSGEGMFRKDQVAINEWSLDNVANCVTRQQDILENAMNCISHDGVLIYSTCTYNQDENEKQIEWLLSEYNCELIEVDIKENWGITKTDFGYRFLPHKTKGEGLFISALKVKTTNSASAKKQKEIKTIKKCEFANYLTNNEDYSFIEHKNLVYAINNRWKQIYSDAINNLNIIDMATPIFEVKGKSKIPQIGLALSKELNRNYIAAVDVDLQTALSYLRCETLNLSSCELGYIAIKYKSNILGWVKNIGNRANNLYPSHWRIRKL